MPKWNDLPKQDQKLARTIREAWWDAGGTTSVSQIALHFETFTAWYRGVITIDDVTRCTGESTRADSDGT